MRPGVSRSQGWNQIPELLILIYAVVYTRVLIKCTKGHLKEQPLFMNGQWSRKVLNDLLKVIPGLIVTIIFYGCLSCLEKSNLAV